jgi:hypothetical protein
LVLPHDGQLAVSALPQRAHSVAPRAFSDPQAKHSIARTLHPRARSALHRAVPC